MSLPHAVVMGVAGSGKSTVGKRLAEKLGARFLEADDLHSAGNIDKMSRGVPLDDTDRWPWLEAVAQQLVQARDQSLVVACSALKRAYRDLLRRADPAVVFIMLHGSRELLSDRIAQRAGHFMPPSMLDSQLDSLEPLRTDERGIILNIAEPPQELIRQAAALFRAGRMEQA